MLPSFSLLPHYEVELVSLLAENSGDLRPNGGVARCSALYLHFLVNLTHSALAWVG